LTCNIRLKEKCLLIIACAAIVTALSLPAALCYPPAGFDYLPSTTANIQVLILQGPMNITDTIVAYGPTNVSRSDPYDPGDGHIKIDTEIVSMNLVGSGAIIGPATIIQSPFQASKGEIRQQVAGVDFPADSFFDVYVEIHTAFPFPFAVLHNDAAVQMNSTISGIPPWGAAYESPTYPPFSIPLIDQNGNIAGFILHCIHTVSGPLCAMKTLTNGYFYIPSKTVSVPITLRIEMLFSQPRLVGDQTGNTTIPYPSIPNWPDQIVNIRDIAFIAKAFGSPEGGLWWNYMADVVPDKIINIKDIAAAAKNFGYVGTGQYAWWSTAITGVTVVFQPSGLAGTPDSLGYVAIPPGDTSFTVYQNGNPIGALVTFW
jgi:hypothetical protein